MDFERSMKREGKIIVTRESEKLSKFRLGSEELFGKTEHTRK